MIRAVLCDIEGTITSVSFAHDVLFPLSRNEMDSFVHTHWNDAQMRPLFTQLGQSAGEVIRLLQSWIDADKKESTLKQIQGKIWKKAFESGQLRAPIYPDVPRKWSEWKDRGTKICIFSSGSVEAQQLLLRYSETGDLTHFVDGYFDTTTGPKKEAASYQKIAHALRLPPQEVLFLSDTPAELDAAGDAEMQTIQIVRDASTLKSGHRIAESFDEVVL